MAVTLENARVAGRKIRRPVHHFNTVQHPWAITPFLIAPVLPGETMKNAVFQARAISKPIKSDLIGWWLEHMVFYVKLRDLEDRDTITDMFVNPDWTKDAIDDNTADPWYNHNGRNRINWPKLCLRRVVQEYFRDEGEAWDIAMYNGLPLAKSGVAAGIFDSVMSEGDYNPPGDVELDLDADGSITAGEAEDAMRQYELLRMMNLTEATYEDFIRSYGIQGRVAEQVDPHRPELLRHEREWTLPSNTVEVGGIRSVVTWNKSFRADKDRFFKEPGFIFGVTVARPKVYLANQTAAAVSLLDHFQAWLPAVLRPDPTTSLVHVPDGTGPIGTDPGPYFVDVRDLFLKGDQWVNHTNDRNAVALPNALNFDKEYISAADLENLFTLTTGMGDRQIRQEGVATFMIASAETRDITATTGKSVTVTV